MPTPNNREMLDGAKIKQIYDVLSKNGYEGDYKTFEGDFIGDTPENGYYNRKQIYDLLKANGGDDIGDSYEDFMHNMMTPVQSSQSTQQQGTQQVNNQQTTQQNLPKEQPKKPVAQQPNAQTPAVSPTQTNVQTQPQQTTTQPNRDISPQSAVQSTLLGGSQPVQQPSAPANEKIHYDWEKKISPELRGMTEKQWRANIENIKNGISERNDANEISAFNAFMTDIANKIRDMRKQGKHAQVVVRTGNQAFRSDNDIETRDLNFTRNNIPDKQDYVWLMRNLINSFTNFRTTYNFRDPEMQKDYDVLLTSNVSTEYQPTDYMLNASARKKNDYYKHYACYIYNTLGEIPEWLDIKDKMYLEHRSQDDPEVKNAAEEWRKMVNDTKGKRPFHGAKSVADWLNKQYYYENGQKRVINGKTFPFFVNSDGLVQAIEVPQLNREVTVADNRKAYNDRLDGSTQGAANASSGNTYTIPYIINEERWQGSGYVPWVQLEPDKKAEYDNDELKYLKEMNERQSTLMSFNVGKGQSYDKALSKALNDSAHAQFQMLTEKEKLMALIAQAKYFRHKVDIAIEKKRKKLAMTGRLDGATEGLTDYRMIATNCNNFIEAAERYLQNRNYSGWDQYIAGLTDENGLTFGITGMIDAIKMYNSSKEPSQVLIDFFGSEKDAKAGVAAIAQMANLTNQYREELGYNGVANGLGSLTQFLLLAKLPIFKVGEVAGEVATTRSARWIEKGLSKLLPKTAARETANASRLVEVGFADGLKAATREGGIGGGAAYLINGGGKKVLPKTIGKIFQGATDGSILACPKVAEAWYVNKTGNPNVLEENRQGIVIDKDKPFVESEESAGSVMAKAYGREVTNWIGMRWGEIFSPVGSAVDKALYSKTIGKYVDSCSASKWTKLFKSAERGKAMSTAGKQINDMMKRAGVGGSLTFYAQENISELLNAMTVGDYSIDDIKDSQLDKIWGCMINSVYMSGVHNVVGTTGYYVQRRGINKNIAKADAQGKQIWGAEDWNAIKSDIDMCSADDATLQAYTNGVLKNRYLYKEQRQAIYQYVTNLKALQAFDVFSAQTKDGKELDANTIKYNDAYKAGLVVQNPTEMAKIRSALNASERAVSRYLGVTPEYVHQTIFSDPNMSQGEAYENAIDMMKKRNNDVQEEMLRGTLNQYFSALNTQRGVSDLRARNLQTELEANDAFVESYKNKNSNCMLCFLGEDGMHYVKTQENPDGTVSTKCIETGKEETITKEESDKSKPIFIETPNGYYSDEVIHIFADAYGREFSVISGSTSDDGMCVIKYLDGGQTATKSVKDLQNCKDNTFTTVQLAKDSMNKATRAKYEKEQQLIDSGDVVPQIGEKITLGDGEQNQEVTILNVVLQGDQQGNKVLDENGNPIVLKITVKGSDGKVSEMSHEEYKKRIQQSIENNTRDYQQEHEVLNDTENSDTDEHIAPVYEVAPPKETDESQQSVEQVSPGDEVKVGERIKDYNGVTYTVKSIGDEEVTVTREDGTEIKYDRDWFDGYIKDGSFERVQQPTEQSPASSESGFKVGDKFVTDDKNEELTYTETLDDGRMVLKDAQGNEFYYTQDDLNENIGKGYLKPQVKSAQQDIGLSQQAQIPQSDSTEQVAQQGTISDGFNKSVDGEQTAEQQGGQPIGQAQPTTEAQTGVATQGNASEPMPTIEVTNGKKKTTTINWTATTPERGHKYVYEEMQLPEDYANQFVDGNLEEAQKRVDKLQKNKPKMSLDPDEFKKNVQEHQAQLAEAQKLLDYWNAVKAEHERVKAEEAKAESEQQQTEEVKAEEVQPKEEEQVPVEEAPKQTEQGESSEQGTTTEIGNQGSVESEEVNNPNITQAENGKDKKNGGRNTASNVDNDKNWKQTHYHNPEVQNHDWSQYKEGDVFDNEGYKYRFEYVSRDENGNVDGVVVREIKEDGSLGVNEKLFPLMFMNDFRKVSDQSQADTGRTESGRVDESNSKEIDAERGKQADAPQEYVYQLTQRPYGIGSQPEGEIRHVDDGSKFGAVVYDHPLSAEEAKNFSLTPITEAKALEGRTFEVPFGEDKDIYHIDKVDDDGTIHYHVNDETPLQSRYHDFLSELGDEAKEVKHSLFENGTTESGEVEPLSDGQVSAITEVSDYLGQKLRVVDSVKDKQGRSNNGLYDPNTGTIYLARDGQQPMGFVFGHEATHAVREMSEGAYGDLHSAVRDLMGDKKWNAEVAYKKQLYKDNGIELTDEGAAEEVVSDYVGSVLNQGENLKKLAYRLKHPVLSKIRESLTKLLDFFRGKKMTAEEKQVQGMLDTITEAMRNAKADGEQGSKEVKHSIFDPRFEKGGENELSPEEHLAAEAMNETLKKAIGDDSVLIDGEVGQRVLDDANKRGIDVREHKGFHGSAADFIHFDHSHMGEGEGAQAYGWGTYITDVKGIAQTYATASAKKNREYRELVDNITKYGIRCDSLKNLIEEEKKRLKRQERQVERDKEYVERKYLEPSEITDAENIAKKQESRLRDIQEKIDSYQKELEEESKNLAEAKKKYAESNIKRHLYTVEIPDDDGGNYLDWVKKPTEGQVNAIANILARNPKEVAKYIWDNQERFYLTDRELIELYENPENFSQSELAEILKNDQYLFHDGQHAYNAIKNFLGSQEKASKALDDIGFVGIKYPADYRRGGREDGAQNFVIFNEENAQITDHVRFFRTKDGIAYGFTVGGKVYIDPRVANSETPIHEYSHLWATAMQKGNPKEWENIVKLMKGTSVWEEVKKTYPELENDSDIADEVLAHYSGRRGAERLREQMRAIADGKGSPLDKADAMNALHKVKAALDKFWKGVADFLGIHFTTAEEVADRVMKDLLDGVDPREHLTKEDIETDSTLRFHKEKDEDTLKKLNSEPTIKVYRAMQVIDGKLYPPMAAKVGNGLVEPNELGVWIRADENPDLAKPKVDKKTGETKWYFDLNKGSKDPNGKDLSPTNGVAYNPYWHTSLSPLNDQFATAWIRPNIVVVECEIPASELTSGYKAEKAHYSVGETPWKSGKVSTEVRKQTGRERKVILSRWCKPVRILSDAEVAQKSKEFIGDADVEIPENVLTPRQKIEFEKVGLKVGAPEKRYNKTEQIEEAIKKGLMVDNSLKSDSDKGLLFRDADRKETIDDVKQEIVSQALKNGTYMLAPNGERTKLDESQWVQVRSKNFKEWAGDWENDPDNASIVLDENGEPLVLNHFTTKDFSVFGKDKEIGENTFENTSDANYAATATIGDWFTTNDNAELDGKPMKVFLKIKNPYDGYSLENLAEEVGGKIKPEDYEAFDEDRDNTSPIIEAGKQFREELESEGYDGIVIEDEEVGGKSYVIFAPNQVKSATKNNGDFSKDNDDIYFRLNDGTFIKSGSYFSGGGLLEEGLKRYLDPSVAVEFNEKISGVYADNFGNHIVTADVRDVDPRELAKNIDGEVQYFHASPVCKNYSRAKRDGGEVELDKETAQSTADFISAKRPKVVTIENVKGYKNSEALKIITDELTKQGYDWDMDVYNAADYGGYTKRERLIIRAVRDGKLPEKPQPLPESERKHGWMEAVEDLIDDLPEKEGGVKTWMDERLKGEGIDYRNIDKPLYVFGQGNNAKSVSHAFADELIPTLRTHGGDVIIMPDGRVLQVTPRVLARLTGLGDDYVMPKTDKLAHTIIGNGIPTQLSENVIGPLLDHAFNGGERASSESMITDKRNAEKRNATTQLTSALHLDGEVEILETNEGLEGKEKHAKGWYDPKTGKITVVLGNHESVADVQKTIFHEAVAHKGLRAMVGEEKFGTFIDNIYKNADKEIQSRIDELAEKKYKGNKRVATEEYMASLAEDMNFEKPENKGLLAKVKKLIVNLLKEAGIDLGFKLTDKDLRYMLWRSYKNLQENGGKRNIFDIAEDARMRERLEQTQGAEERAANAEEQQRMFRDGNDTLRGVVDGMRDLAQKMVTDQKKDKNETIGALTSSLKELNKAMSAQRAYDLSTVKSVTGLVKDMLDSKLIQGVTDYEQKRMLSVIENVHGKNDTRRYVTKLMDIAVGNMERNASSGLMQLLHTRGQKVDQRGVVVQKGLDPDGQKLAGFLKSHMGSDAETINNRMIEVQNRMSSNNEAIAESAAIEYQALQLADYYRQYVKDSKENDKQLRQELADTKEKLDAGEIQMTKADFRQYQDEINFALLQNKIGRAQALQDLINNIGGQYKDSAERAKAWQEQEKKRVGDIYHNANSDLEGVPCRDNPPESLWTKFTNSALSKLLFDPQVTFANMLEFLGKKSATGRGYLYNRFMHQAGEATNNEIVGYRGAVEELDNKAKEMFGKDFTKLMLKANGEKPATLYWMENGENMSHQITVGNMLYIYMVNKMADGRMKLRKMGISDENVNAIVDKLNEIDPSYIQFADWMQNEFLPSRRNKYNEVHKRMFGTSMPEVEDYFPLKILKNAIKQDHSVDATQPNDKPSTTTGAIKKRTRNSLPLDLLNADAFEVLLGNVKEMEHWAAFAEFDRDINTLKNYQKFRNKLQNMSSLRFGSGEKLLESFDTVCNIAAGTFGNSGNQITESEKAAVNITKLVTASKIGFRFNTALKQLWSFPAYLSDSNVLDLTMSTARPDLAWKFAMTLPQFRERVKGRFAGDPIMATTEADWKGWRGRVVDLSAKYGMSANAFVDAVTVAIGSHAMYKTRYRKLIKQGYDPETADARAREFATEMFNKSQQSSLSMYMSPLQSSISWYSRLLSLFRNASMSYSRQTYASIQRLGQKAFGGKDNYQTQIDFMTKQFERDGIDHEQAVKNAKSEFWGSIGSDIVRFAVYNSLLTGLWNLGYSQMYMIFGNDNEEKKKLVKDAFLQSLLGGIEGLTAGDVISNGLFAFYKYSKGEADDLGNDDKDMPIISDIKNIWDYVGHDNMMAIQSSVDLLGQSITGIAPTTVGNILGSLGQFFAGDWESVNDCVMLFCKVMNAPKSNMDKIYLDEIGATLKEGKNMSVEEIAKRYAEYKRKNKAPLVDWAYSAEDKEKANAKYANEATDKAREIISGEYATDDYKQLVDESKQTGEKLKKINELEFADRDEYNKQRSALVKTPEYRRHMVVEKQKNLINKAIQKYLREPDPNKRAELMKYINERRDYMVNQSKVVTDMEIPNE